MSKNISNTNETKQSRKTGVIRNFLDHIECVSEELKMNGYDVRVIKGTSYNSYLIEYDSIAGRMKYQCSEKTIMGDFYRFISHLGSKLHKWGLENKVSEY